ncbi:MAG: MBL fold metallo-hydrolase [Candidatus Methanoplasma sp.]|jgi:7,8-dihydropterin-6-yl-methyl-4-(beta-D-ribofuranosyl)aminobenzene 5'-phosphate synthase|nr:MBL fold metallo-hydrolase [Candidatus Methanoplasma sp.]
MQAKITSVYDEGSLEGTSLIGAKGFAVLIETDGQRILFDTGRTGRYLLHNMMFLDIEPGKIDKIVISHGHAGHTGGVVDLLMNRETPVKIYAPHSAIGTKRLLGAKGLYIPEELSEKADLNEVRDWLEISKNVFVSAPTDIGDGKTESFMAILSKKGPVVIAACSHAGTDTIMESVKKKFGAYPNTYIGGVHLGKKDKQRAAAMASSFSEKNCKDLHLNHCTGISGMMHLRTVLGLKGVSDFYVGSILYFDI